MKGIRLDLEQSGAKFNFDEPIEDFSALIQNCLVNVGTSKDTDRVFEEKGTDLLKDAVSGLLVDPGGIAGSAQFASVDTLFFIRDNTPDGFDVFVDEIRLVPVDFDINNLQIETKFISSDGTEIGNLTTLST
jgi:hypothetical protein